MRAYEIIKEDILDCECGESTCVDCAGKNDDNCGCGESTCVDCTGQKAELDEIKVTKTLAMKRTTPMHDLATKTKMKRKKKGTDGKVKKDAVKPMNRNVHDLANITLKGEYRS